MNTNRSILRIIFLVMVFCFGGSIWGAWKLQQLRPEASLEEVLYVNSAKTVKYMSLGYTGLAADFYWTRAVQYFGSKHHEHSMQFQLLYPLLKLTTDLDPHLTVAYEFGSFFLAQKPPQGAGSPDLAVSLVERGIQENPEQWRLYYHLGFIHAIERKDYEKSAEAFEKGSQVPGAQPWMKVMVAVMRQRGGDLQTARYLWTNIYENSDSASIKQNAYVHLVALKVEEDVTVLEELVERYTKATGAYPRGWEDLINVGYIHGTPLDPSQNQYRLDARGHVYVNGPDKFPFIRKGLPEGATSKEMIDDQTIKPRKQ